MERSQLRGQYEGLGGGYDGKGGGSYTESYIVFLQLNFIGWGTITVSNQTTFFELAQIHADMFFIQSTYNVSLELGITFDQRTSLPSSSPHFYNVYNDQRGPVTFYTRILLPLSIL